MEKEKVATIITKCMLLRNSAPTAPDLHFMTQNLCDFLEHKAPYMTEDALYKAISKGVLGEYGVFLPFSPSSLIQWVRSFAETAEGYRLRNAYKEKMKISRVPLPPDTRSQSNSNAKRLLDSFTSVKQMSLIDKIVCYNYLLRNGLLSVEETELNSEDKENAAQYIQELLKQGKINNEEYLAIMQDKGYKKGFRNTIATRFMRDRVLEEYLQESSK